MKRITVVLKAFSTAISLLSYRALAVPLVLYFLLKLFIIYFYVASGAGPQNRFWALFSQGISADQLSHYPEHLLYMPSVLGRLDMALEVFVLVLAQGATVLLMAGALRRARLGLGTSLRRAAARYHHLVVAAAATSAAIYACFALIPMLARVAGGAAERLGLAACTILALFIQTLFIYSMQFILLEGKPALGAIGGSFRLSGRTLVDSFLLVFLPFIPTIPALLLNLKPELVAFRLSPELLIHMQVAGEIMQLIMTYLLIGGVTVFFVRTRERTEAAK